MSTCNCTEIMARFKFYVCFFFMKWKYIRKFDYECVCLCIFELSNIKKNFLSQIYNLMSLRKWYK